MLRRRRRRPANSWPTLPTEWTSTPASASSSQIAARPAAASEKSRRPSVRSEAPRPARERPRDHAPDGVLGRAAPARTPAQIAYSSARARRRPRGRRSGAPSPGSCRRSAAPSGRCSSAEVLDRLDPVVRLGCRARRARSRPCTIARPPRPGSRSGTSAARAGRHDSHQLPVTGGRVLARARARAGGRGAPASRAGGTPGQRERSIRAQARPSTGSDSPPTSLRQVRRACSCPPSP